MSQIIQNSKGESVDVATYLNAKELHRANMLQDQYNRELKNAIGYEIPITTLTAITKTVTEQKFYTVPFADFVPVRMNEGSWSRELLTYRSFNLGGGFDTGIVNTGNSNNKLANVNVGVDAVTVKVANWAKEIQYSFMDLQIAARSGNWDLVTSLETARKTEWDLGLQEVAFWGSASTSGVKGLLTQTDVNSNTSLITKKISAMTSAEFDTFVQGALAAYAENCAYTATPTHFIIPQDDFLGLGAPVSATYPNVTKLEYLLKIFRMMTSNDNFKILPLAYANKSRNANISGLNKNRYTLLNFNEQSIRMDIPVQYTSTLMNTINGFNFQNVGYGQFTGVQTYRPLETLYFDWS